MEFSSANEHSPAAKGVVGLMRRAFLIRIICALAILGMAFRSALAAPVPLEKAKIDALIADLETKSDAKFVRNGSEYDAKSAAKFLRGKWQAHDGEIKTAADFIAKAATGSSTSGKPYLIRFKDGSEVRCSEYLSAKLKKLESN